MNFQVYVLRTAMLKFTEHLPQEGRGDPLPTRERMHDQVFDEGTGPALRDSDDVLSLILCEKKRSAANSSSARRLGHSSNDPTWPPPSAYPTSSKR